MRPRTEGSNRVGELTTNTPLAVFGRSGGKERSVNKIGDALIVDDLETGQVRIVFHAAPHFKAKNILKANQFKWAPKSKSWQSQRSDKALYLAQEIAKFDKEMKEEQ